MPGSDWSPCWTSSSSGSPPRVRCSNDSVLPDSRSTCVVRKHLGYSHIASDHPRTIPFPRATTSRPTSTTTDRASSLRNRPASLPVAAPVADAWLSARIVAVSEETRPAVAGLVVVRRLRVFITAAVEIVASAKTRSIAAWCGRPREDPCAIDNLLARLVHAHAVVPTLHDRQAVHRAGRALAKPDRV